MSEHNVPGYLAWFLLYGTEDGTNREKRRQIALNSFALFNGLFTLAFAIFYPLYNIDLWPLFFVLVFLSAVTFALPLISRFGDMIALAWTTFFGAGNLLVQTYLLSNASVFSSISSSFRSASLRFWGRHTSLFWPL